MDLRTTIALVSSRSEPTVYGTGFVIHANATRSYLVTCAHVVRDIQKASPDPEDLLVDNTSATIEAIGTPETIDLAVLSVPRLADMPPLPLSKVATEGAMVEVYGQYTIERKSAKLAERLRGTLHKETANTSTAFKVRSFRLKLQEDDRIQPGYSGGAVVCEGLAIGVAAVQRDQGSEAIAIMVEAVANIWPGMPPDLFDPVRPSVVPVSSSSVVKSPPVVSMDWNKDRKKALRQALETVYGEYSKLKVFVTSELGESLPTIVGDQNMTVACFELVEWGCAKGRIDELFAAFVAENPGHPLAVSGSAPLIAASGESVGGSGVWRRLERERLEKQFAMLTKQYQAVSDRLLTEQNPTVVPQLEQQLEEIAAKMMAIEDRLKEL